MKFSNAIAFCKGFYESRGDVDTMWKDLAHCINVDGWMCYTKKDVARWCCHRLEDFSKEFPNESWKVSFGIIFSDIQDKKNLWENIGYNKPLEDYDYIIWAFRDFVRYKTDDNMFTSGIIPSAEVLPIKDYVIDGFLYKSMLEDNRFSIQQTEDFFEDYDSIENKLK